MAVQCDSCGKREATVHYTEVIGGKATDLHLCGECAGKKGLVKPLSKTKFSVADFLAGLTEGLEADEIEKESQIRCKSCGLSYAEFRRIGKLGCSECYSSFATKLDPLLRRIHGSTRHTGKFIQKSGAKAELKRELAALQKKLDAAIAEEKFEDAAGLRDRLKTLQQSLGDRSDVESSD
jgi:protein arginine kinase activator